MKNEVKECFLINEQSCRTLKVDDKEFGFTGGLFSDYLRDIHLKLGYKVIEDESAWGRNIKVYEPVSHKN